MRKKAGAGSSARRTSLVPLDVPGALDKLGIDYVMRGNECSARCPYHEDSSPSWSMNIDTGEHHCFSCDFGGSFASLVAYLNKSWSRDDVAQWITDRKVRDVAEGRTSRDHEEAKPEPISAADMWEFTPPPRAALRSRGLTSFSAEDYGVRWNARNETFILPIRDPEQRFKIIGWQEKGRNIFRNHPEHIEKARTLFGLELVESQLPVVLVESPLDCVRLLDAGIPNAVASYGASVSQAQYDLVTSHASTVILAFDNDEAGRVATVKASNALRGLCTVNIFAYDEPRMRGTLRVHVAKDGRDPGDMSHGELRWGVENATPSWRTGFED